jgi:bis(5'-nucleosidyl)-tetraphosphatase
VVVVNVAGPEVQYLLLRAYRNWDFPKGLVEPGEQPLDAALREVREETTLENLAFDWGKDFMDTGPYNKGKISRYYIARSNDTRVHLPINPELGFPEHQEARWVKFDTALSMVSPRLLPVMHWASATIKA